MDIFKHNQSLNANLGNTPPPDKLNAQVSFDAGSEFNLSFFDTTEECTQGYNETASLDSTSSQIASSYSILFRQPTVPSISSRNPIKEERLQQEQLKDQLQQIEQLQELERLHQQGQLPKLEPNQELEQIQEHLEQLQNHQDQLTLQQDQIKQEPLLPEQLEQQNQIQEFENLQQLDQFNNLQQQEQQLELLQPVGGLPQQDQIEPDDPNPLQDLQELPLQEQLQQVQPLLDIQDPDQEQEQQKHQLVDSNSVVKTFVPCKVCGDKASGYHYGVTSCEGCKGFFRRSIQKQIEYRCLRDGKCLVIRLNRNRCQYCRFKKCLAVGMSRDSVRYGRVPKRCREQNDEGSHGSGSETPEQIDMENKNSAVYDTILIVSQAHHAHCDYIEESTRGIEKKPIISPFSMSTVELTTTTLIHDETERIWLWQQLAANIGPTVHKVVEFAKRVPGFLDLSQDDQLILVKSGFIEVWFVHVARLISDTGLTFFNGAYITKEQMSTVYDMEFVDDLFKFASTFNSLGLNDTEIGLFSGAILLTPERSGLTDTEAVKLNQETMLSALKIQVTRTRTCEPHVAPTMLSMLPQLRSLGFKHVVHVNWFRMHWHKMKLPPLFAETFDITKSEDDLDLDPSLL